MPIAFPRDKRELFFKGLDRMARFCDVNKITVPKVTEAGRWPYDYCAYYRQDRIAIHLDSCAWPSGPNRSRNWNWPGSTTDREPYGVIAHELGHHMDYSASESKGAYFGDYSQNVRSLSDGEKPITSYCPNDAEWFAEMARLFITNPNLLKQLRPTTYKVLCEKWEPLRFSSWVAALGTNVPNHIVSNLIKKGAQI